MLSAVSLKGERYGLFLLKFHTAEGSPRAWLRSDHTAARLDGNRRVDCGKSQVQHVADAILPLAEEADAAFRNVQRLRQFTFAVTVPDPQQHDQLQTLVLAPVVHLLDATRCVRKDLRRRALLTRLPASRLTARFAVAGDHAGKKQDVVLDGRDGAEYAFLTGRAAD